MSQSASWLDRRIAEVVGASPVYWKPPTLPETREEVVVCMKMRMPHARWRRMKLEFDGWARDGVVARFTSRFAKDHPRWYDRFSTDIR